MEGRSQFIKDFRRGESSLSELCRICGISRPTAYKWLERYHEHGMDGLRDLSRAPHCHPNAIGAEVADLILELRGRHSSWGPKKLLWRLSQDRPKLRLPSASAVGDLLKRSGLSFPRRRRRRCEPSAQPFGRCDGPNVVWCSDFKGWFKTGDGRRVDPLTISDAYSRYLIRCQGMRPVTLEGVQRLFAASFREFGLPLALRTDNGSPFASSGLGGLSRLSVWWIRLGIVPERIEPGQPQQNGRLERLHRTLKQETASPAASDLRSQQVCFDRFRSEYNHDRPHEALGQRPPSWYYEASSRSYPERLAQVEYPLAMVTRVVQKRGEIYWQGSRVFVSETLAGERLGLQQVSDRSYEVYFSHVRLGLFDPLKLKVFRCPRPAHWHRVETDEGETPLRATPFAESPPPL